MPTIQCLEPSSTGFFNASGPLADPHRAVLRAIEATRRTHEELERRSLELKTAIRRDGQMVALWRRQIQETEAHLARWRFTLAEAESRLEQTRREFALLAVQSTTIPH